MRRVFLTIITITQLFGALLFFSILDTALKQTPISAMDMLQKSLIGIAILIYLLGLIGSILIWLSKRAGIWMSLLHQLPLIPLFIVPGGIYWVLGDAFSIAAVIWQAGSAFNFNLLFNLGDTSLLDALKPMADKSYYGVNIFALICAVYLNRQRRKGLFA